MTSPRCKYNVYICIIVYTQNTAIPVIWIAVVATVRVLENSVFYGYLTAASVSFGLPIHFVHCCISNS